MNRREIIKLGLAAPLLLQNGARVNSLMGTHRKLTEFGVQLSTITAVMAADFEGGLKAVSEIGYQMVEFSALGFLGRSAQDVKMMLAKYQLTAPVGRVSFRMTEGFMQLPREQQMKQYARQGGINTLLDRISHSIEEAKILDQKYLIIPAIMPASFSSRVQVDLMLKILHEAAELCQKSDIVLGYHNHNWEFNDIDGIIPFDLMLEEMEPDKFTFQMDTYWVMKAGKDPLRYLQEYPGRFVTCHFKDISEDGDFANVGQGLIDFPSFTKAALAQGAQYFFVERDNPEDPMDTITRSYQYLESMEF